MHQDAVGPERDAKRLRRQAGQPRQQLVQERAVGRLRLLGDGALERWLLSSSIAKHSAACSAGSSSSRPASKPMLRTSGNQGRAGRPPAPDAAFFSSRTNRAGERKRLDYPRTRPPPGPRRPAAVGQARQRQEFVVVPTAVVVAERRERMVAAAGARPAQ
ncbi:MAG: hypothetical protein IPI57_15000 [Candidatus Competibacteraceae bacterium]|nr:hypothetical protein [Candidatus Competibacteraceae bacterium]